MIVVTAATGTVGSETVRQLAGADHQVRALVRDPAKAARLDGTADVVVADLASPRSLVAAFADADRAFVISPVTPELEILEANAFRAAAEAGVTHIVACPRGDRTSMGKPLTLITGATGTIGSHLVPQLIARGARVRTLVRDPKKAMALGAGFEIFVGDLANPETLPAALNGVDKLFVISNGSNIADLEGNILEAARNSDVRHIVKISGRHLDASFMADVPLAINQNAAEAHLKSLGVDWTIIRPGMFASNFLLWIDHARGIVPLPVGDGRDTPTDPVDIAAVGCEILIGSDHEGKIYEITGPEFLTFRDMTARIARAIDQPLELVDIPPEVAYQGMISSGVPDTQAQGIIRYFEAVRQGQVYPPTDTIQHLLGRQPRRFDDWVTSHLRELRRR